MSAATELTWKGKIAETALRSLFDHAPFPFVQWRAGGEIVGLNPALGGQLINCPKVALRFADLLPANPRAAGEPSLGTRIGVLPPRVDQSSPDLQPATNLPPITKKESKS